ncbi:hypothetical protein EVAR_16585_1 [Eumeta japonica]|uniref:Uncharacterized protein n=1 Tax=Eumeta variegata TaxID=151549 RepID=A0A4C1U371_EUMVA|nr:hypothetical protein EVAR_16585_1 [Eumeta japonica]
MLGLLVEQFLDCKMDFHRASYSPRRRVTSRWRSSGGDISELLRSLFVWSWYFFLMMSPCVKLTLKGQNYVPRSYYTIDAEGHVSAPVMLRRLRRDVLPYPLGADYPRAPGTDGVEPNEISGLTMPEWKGRVPLTRSHCERITRHDFFEKPNHVRGKNENAYLMRSRKRRIRDGEGAGAGATAAALYITHSLNGEKGNGRVKKYLRRLVGSGTWERPIGSAQSEWGLVLKNSRLRNLHFEFQGSVSKGKEK